MPPLAANKNRFHDWLKTVTFLCDDQNMNDMIDVLKEFVIKFPVKNRKNQGEILKLILSKSHKNRRFLSYIFKEK